MGQDVLASSLQERRERILTRNSKASLRKQTMLGGVVRVERKGGRSVVLVDTRSSGAASPHEELKTENPGEYQQLQFLIKTSVLEVSRKHGNYRSIVP